MGKITQNLRKLNTYLIYFWARSSKRISEKKCDLNRSHITPNGTQQMIGSKSLAARFLACIPKRDLDLGKTCFFKHVFVVFYVPDIVCF